jgi:hypothetical protein
VIETTSAADMIMFKMHEAFRAYHHRDQRWVVNVCRWRASKIVAAVN